MFWIYPELGVFSDLSAISREVDRLSKKPCLWRCVNSARDTETVTGLKNEVRKAHERFQVGYI